MFKNRSLGNMLPNLRSYIINICLIEINVFEYFSGIISNKKYHYLIMISGEHAPNPGSRRPDTIVGLGLYILCKRRTFNNILRQHYYQEIHVHLTLLNCSIFTKFSRWNRPTKFSARLQYHYVYIYSYYLYNTYIAHY